MSVAVASPPRADPPRLLLDTNVYVDLAEGLLPSEGARLLKIAAHRTPPLVWACEITFDELICHVRQKEESDFPKYRSAFGWMDRLCGNLGMAEDLAWVLHRGVFVGLLPYRGSLPIALNRARREVIKASAFADLRPEFRETVKVLRQEYEGRIQRWVGWRTELHNAARVEPTPGQSGKEGWQLVTEAVREVSRKHIKEDASLWGGFRTDADQELAQREIIGFELSHLLKSRNPQGYNIQKHRSDFNDSWLCAYPAAGYTLVTTDARLRDAIKLAKCPSPRIASMDEGLALAEKWLADQV